MSEDTAIKTEEIDGHVYSCQTHSTLEGLPIVGAILAALPGPLLTALHSLRENTSESIVDMNLDGIFSEINLKELGPEVAEAIRNLSERPALIASVFKHTTRDGNALGKQREFDKAYSGNWGEFYKALFWVVKVNGFVPLGSTSED